MSKGNEMTIELDETAEVLFRCSQGWVFDVKGSDLDGITAVSWEGAELDVVDFIEQLEESDRDELDALLRERTVETLRKN